MSTCSKKVCATESNASLQNVNNTNNMRAPLNEEHLSNLGHLNNKFQLHINKWDSSV